MLSLQLKLAHYSTLALFHFEIVKAVLVLHIPVLHLEDSQFCTGVDILMPCCKMDLVPEHELYVLVEKSMDCEYCL